MNYKLIATDMDDTLLNESQEISAGNEKAIVKAQKNGVKFVLASGRPSFAMFEYAKKLQMDKFEGYILAFNGGELIDSKNNEIVFEQGLDKNDIKTVYNAAKKLNLTMLLYRNDTVFATSEDAEKYMKEIHGNDYFIAISKPIFLEIANKNVNKGKTLARLGKILGIKTEEMIAVGDSGNDKPLLETVGMPVAVANATEEIKNLSKFVSTSNDESALKTVIENFFDF